MYFTDNIIGKVVAVEAKYLSAGYKDRGHQLYYVVGGFGAYPNSRGQACFSYNLYDGKKERMSGSDIRMTVNEMRCRGVPICSSARGYYYAKTTEDIERTLRHLNSRAEKIQKAREGM